MINKKKHKKQSKNEELLKKERVTDLLTEAKELTAIFISSRQTA